MARPTVLVLGRRTTDNMPSLTRMMEILKPEPETSMPSGMHVEAPRGSVRITSCPKMSGCPMGDACLDPDNRQDEIDRCPEC